MTTPQLCALKECGRRSRTLGLCNKHYQRFLRHGDPLDPPKRICSEGGCSETYYALGYCTRHYYVASRVRDGLPMRTPRDGCEVEGCDKPHDSLGLCKNHYCQAARWRWKKPVRKPISPELARLRAERRANWRAANPELAQEQRMRAKAKRRARLAGVKYEEFGRLVVFERDGWICQICDCRVMRHRKHPDPLSASLDHIIPLALGGDHTQENTQLAHLRCNLMKSDRLVA